MNAALRLLRSSTFRFTLAYLLMFALSVGGLGYYLYNETFGASGRQTEQLIDQEIDTLARVYASGGADRLNRVISDRGAFLDGGLYMLIAAPAGAPLSGNMNGVPPEALVAGPAFFRFTYERTKKLEDEKELVEQRRAIGKIRSFRSAPEAESFLLVFVARDISDIEDLRDRTQRQLIRIGGATLGVGLLIGLVFARSLLARVESVNKTAKAIRAGDLSRRVALTGSGDELEDLAVNLNDMLDQIERLMNGMKEVSDNIAHDLRSPLTRIKNRLTDAINSQGSERDDAVRATLDEAEKMIGTFNALLSIARIESGEGAGAKERIELGSIAAELAELYEPAAQEAGFQLKLDVAPAPEINGSRELISQALANLLDNALKYAEGGDTITISVKKSARGGALLSVADDGVGVPPADRDKILKRFVRLESSRPSGGSGLGLSLVSAIARAHGAGLRVSGADRDDDAKGLKVTLAFRPA